MKLSLLIVISFAFLSCIGSKTNTPQVFVPEIWTFEEAKIRYDNTKIEFPKLYEHADWVDQELDCREEESSFSFPEKGIRDMHRKVLYPPEARKNGTQGKVEAMYTISAIGELTDIKILMSPSPEISNVARNVLNSTQFVQAYCNRSPIASTNVLTLNFTLQDQY